MSKPHIKQIRLYGSSAPGYLMYAHFPSKKAADMNISMNACAPTIRRLSTTIRRLLAREKAFKPKVTAND